MIDRIPFKKRFWELIKKGIKTTTIRTTKWHYVIGKTYSVNDDLKIKILGKRPIYIPRDINAEIVKSEGFKDKNELLGFFNRHKLPQMVFIYIFKVVK